MKLLYKLKSHFQKKNTHKDKITINKNNLYIIPNKIGLSYLFICFILYLIAVNYQNNLIYLILFILISVFIVSIFHTHKNLINSSWQISNIKNVFAGNNSGIFIKINKEVMNVEATINKKIFTLTDNKSLYIELPTYKRGLMNIPRIKIQSSYPIGLFTSFTYLNFTQQLIIFPSLNDKDLNSNSNYGQIDGQNESILNGMDDFSHLKPYSPGDNVKQIHWKSYSKNDLLFIKQFSQNNSSDVFLNLQNQSGDIEQKLSTLTTAIVKLTELQIAFGLILPNEIVEMNHGENHKILALSKLALYNSNHK